MSKLGEMLIREKAITREQLDRALELQRESYDFLGSVLVKEGLLTEEQLVEVLARQTGSPPIDLAKVQIEKDLTRLVPWRLARQYFCIPVRTEGKLLYVAMLDCADVVAIDNIGFFTNKVVKTFVAGQTALVESWKQLYGADLVTKDLESFSGNGKRSKTDVLKVEQLELDVKKLEESVEEINVAQFGDALLEAIEEVDALDDDEEESESSKVVYDLETIASSSPVINLVNGMIIKALDMRASDIHIEAFENETRVRFRIDGVLHSIMTLPVLIRRSLTSRIKVLAKLDIAERRLPQDGRIKLRIGRTLLDLRVSTVPSVYGEKIVMRLLGQQVLKDRVLDLGFAGSDASAVEAAVRSPTGIILVTGPTGSGKTTTLYTILKELNNTVRNIVTVEDPVEYEIYGITQVPIKAAIGLDFPRVLRSFLRQDPDIIMLGEVRDGETANIAVKAALTGHLVLSTIHTNDAIWTLARIIDMGVPPYLCAAAIRLIIAQRLIRKLCPECKEPADAADFAELKLLGKKAAEIKQLYRAGGCDACDHIGYRGRMPLFEVLPLASREMKSVVKDGADHDRMYDLAVKEGYTTLAEKALVAVAQGITSIEEAVRVTEV